MEKNDISTLIKEDLKNLKNADFRPLSEGETYGVAFKFVIKYAIFFTVMQSFMVFIAFHLGVRDVYILKPMNIIFCFLSNFLSASILILFLMNYIMLYGYLKRTMKSMGLIKSKLWKLFFIYSFMHLGLDSFYLDSNLNVFAFETFFNTIPCAIFCAFIINCELNRLALGPVINLIMSKFSPPVEQED